MWKHHNVLKNELGLKKCIDIKLSESGKTAGNHYGSREIHVTYDLKKFKY